MSNMTPTRFGEANGNAADFDALFLKQYAGEVLTAFQENVVTASRHMVRAIVSGKSASFPSSWKGTAGYHTPGTQLLGTSVLTNERVITIDDVLIADRAVAQIDELKSHFDIRAIYSRDQGMALARAWDQNVLQLFVLAARAAANITGANGGTVITNATALTNADSLIASIFDGVQALDEKDVPEQDRYVFLKPDQYYNLVNSGSKAIHMDYNGGSSNGSVADGKVYRIAGAEIVKTNFLPSTNVNTGPAAYQGNFTTTAACVAQKGAVGTVKLLDLRFESQWLIEYQTTLMVAKYAIGSGILRPECSVEIKTS